MNKLENLLSKFDNVKPKGRKGNQWIALCTHGEKTPSLNIKYEDGKLLLKCFAGCDTQQIVESVGLTMADLFETNQENMEMVSIGIAPAKEKGKSFKSIEEIKSQFKTLEAAYKYYREDDFENPSHLQIRYKPDVDSKSFATYYREDDLWYAGRGTELVPLYNLKTIKDSKTAIIVEGEKVVEILAEYGIAATCSLGGSNAAHSSDFTPLASKTSVAIWEDADLSGHKYGEDVKSILSNLGISLRRVEVEKLKLEKGGDLEQFIELQTGKSKEEIRKLIYAQIPKAEHAKPSSYLQKYLTDVYEGNVKNLEIIGFPQLTELTQMFIPGSISLIYSRPGLGKSLLTQQIANDWTLNGTVKVKQLFLESSISMYLLRCMSRLTKRFDVLNTSFHFENQKLSKQLYEECINDLDLCGETMTTYDSAFGKKVTEWDEKGVVTWLEQSMKTNDVVILDPISRVLGLGRSPVWEVTNRLTAQIEKLLSENTHCRVVIVHHPDAEGTAISGGAGWYRFCHNVLFLDKFDNPELHEVIDVNGDKHNVEIDRYVKIKKCRSGSGLDSSIGIKLSTEGGLGFEEVGKIIRKIK